MHSLPETKPTSERTLLGVLKFYRFVACGLVIWFGFALIAGLGTSHWGFSVAGVLSDVTFALFLLGPASLIPFIGCRRRVMLIGAAITFTLGFIPGEVFARAQEFIVLRTYGDAPSEDLIISRWPPYEHHTIAYYKDSGWRGWD